MINEFEFPGLSKIPQPCIYMTVHLRYKLFDLEKK